MSIVRIAANSRHRLSVGRTDASGRPLALSALREPVVAGGDGEARRQPLDVVLERAGQRLVEVVEVEHQARSGDANTPKFDRCASPQSCTLSPAVGVLARSAAMIFAAPR